MLIFFVLLLLFAGNSARGQSSGTCGSSCLFRLCKPDDDATVLAQGAGIILRAPRDASYPYICRKFSDSSLLSTILRTGEAAIQASIGRRPSLIPISKWRPSGLKPRFRKNFFKVAKIPLSQQLFNPLQSVSRTKTAGNQDELLDGRCVILPILSYDFADRLTRKFFRVEKTTPKDCVAFTVRNPDLVVDLTWSLAENLDLMVLGPGGDTGVSVDGERGLKITRKSNKRCVGGRESVIFENASPGNYTVMFSNSGPGTSTRTEMTLPTFARQSVVSRQGGSYPNCETRFPTGNWRMIKKFPSKKRFKRRYELKVTWNGRTVLKKKGKYRVGRREKLGTVTFRIPV